MTNIQLHFPFWVSITFAFTYCSPSNFFYKIYNKLKKINSTRNKVDRHNQEHAHEFKYLNFSLQNIKGNRIDPLFYLQNINEKATSIYKLN